MLARAATASGVRLKASASTSIGRRLPAMSGRSRRAASTPSYADRYDSIEQASLIPSSTLVGTGLGEVQLGWIHAPFYTGPDCIPPTVSRQPPPVSPSPPPAK